MKKKTFFLFFILWMVLAFALDNAVLQVATPAPDFENVPYGSHKSQRIDIWLTDSPKPTPLVAFIHGGGFRGGRKESIRKGRTVAGFLQAGISVAAIEYRLIGVAPLPAAHEDATRAIQFIRSKAKEWNIDKNRIGAFGGSAGAQLCMYLAFHDDMTEPDSPDPIARESTRLACVATSGGQTTMLVNWWKKWIPGYTEPQRDFKASFGATTEKEYIEKAEKVSALLLASKDDPPIYMSYRMAPQEPVPSDTKKARGWKVHNVMFGVKLKEKLDKLGVEAVLVYPGVKSKYKSQLDFFKQKLLK